MGSGGGVLSTLKWTGRMVAFVSSRECREKRAKQEEPEDVLSRLCTVTGTGTLVERPGGSCTFNSIINIFEDSKHRRLPGWNGKKRA